MLTQHTHNRSTIVDLIFTSPFQNGPHTHALRPRWWQNDGAHYENVDILNLEIILDHSNGAHNFLNNLVPVLKWKIARQNARERGRESKRKWEFVTKLENFSVIT